MEKEIEIDRERRWSMSYRMYIASHSKQSEQERGYIFQTVILPQMLAEEDTQDYFWNFEFLKKFGCEEELCLGQENVIDKIFHKCPSYIPQSVVETFKDYLPTDASDENFIGILTKDLLWEYIQELHKDYIRLLKRRYQECKTNKDKAADFALRYLAGQLTTYETSLTFLNEKEIPFSVRDSFPYFLLQIYELYRKTDFNKTDLIIYGY